MDGEQAVENAAADLAADAAALAAQAASTNDIDEEDFSWLTERLDALDQRQTALLSIVTEIGNREVSPELTQAMQSQAEQNRTLTDLVNSTQQRLTELHELVLLKLTPAILTNSSLKVDTELTPTNPIPANPVNDGLEAQTEPGEVAGAKKRHRI